MRNRLILLLFSSFCTTLVLDQDPAQPINNGLMEMHSNYRLYSRRDSARVDSLYKGLIGGGYVTYGGADARYRRTAALIDYNLDLKNQPNLFSGSYNALTDKPVIPVLPIWITQTNPGYALSSSLGSMASQNATGVSITGGTASLTSLNLTNYNSAAPQLRVGSLEMQGADGSTSFFAHNAHYEDGDYRLRTAGAAGLWGFFGNEGQFRFANSGVANSYSTALATKTQMKIDASGNWGVGAALPIEPGVYDGAAMKVVGPTGNVLIGTTVEVPSAKLVITSTSQGVLFPRLTTAQIGAITLPADGLYVYDISLHVHKYYNASTSTWKIVATTN